MKQNNITNSITKEGIDKMKLLAGQSTSWGYIDLNTLYQLYRISSQDGRSPVFGLSVIYEMGRIDGIRQERENRKQKSNSIDDNLIKEISFNILPDSNDEIAI